MVRGESLRLLNITRDGDPPLISDLISPESTSVASIDVYRVLGEGLCAGALSSAVIESMN